MCIQVPCVYLLSAASTVIRNTSVPAELGLYLAAGSCARLRYHCFIEHVHIDDRTAQLCNLAVKNAVIQGENTGVFRNYLGLASTFGRQRSEKVVFSDDTSRTMYLVNMEFPPTWMVFMEYEFEAASPRQLWCA